MTEHQKKQIEVINEIERQVKEQSINFSTITPVEDFENDPRLALTSVHFPSRSLLSQIKENVITPLSQIEPDIYYFPQDALHTTIKNIRVVSDPPTFTNEDIQKAETVFSEVLPRHTKYTVYFYRLLLFPSNVALIGTTDPQLDEIYLDLSRGLQDVGLVDNKKYMNSSHFFCNMTLARFSHVSDAFIQKAEELSRTIQFEPYTVDSISLLTCNAVMKKREIIHTWELP